MPTVTTMKGTECRTQLQNKKRAMAYLEGETVHHRKSVEGKQSGLDSCGKVAKAEWR